MNTLIMWFRELWTVIYDTSANPLLSSRQVTARPVATRLAIQSRWITSRASQVWTERAEAFAAFICTSSLYQWRHHSVTALLFVTVEVCASYWTWSSYALILTSTTQLRIGKFIFRFPFHATLITFCLLKSFVFLYVSFLFVINNKRNII